MYRLGKLTHLDTTTGITSITGVMLPSAQPISYPTGFTFARASLEGMPVDLRLEIMLHLPDLPTLRLLRLAGREYYFTARACESSLRALHQVNPVEPDRANVIRMNVLRRLNPRACSWEEAFFQGRGVSVR